MRVFVTCFLLAFMLISVASAEMLVTANPIGQGKWAFLGAGLQDSSVGGSGSTLTMTTIGGYAGYGVTDKLDVFAQLGQASFSVGSTKTTILGLTLKYEVMEESVSFPVSVSVGGGYKSLSTDTGGSTTSGNQMLVGVGVSKLMAPFIPYGGLTYRTTSSGGTTTQTQSDLTVGSAIAWSAQGAVFVEYTMQSITPNGGSAYTSGQIGLGVGYSI